MNYEAQYKQYVADAEAALKRQAYQCLRKDSSVSDAACYSLFGGGKRVRAVLCLAVCEMLGGSPELAECYAAGVEMLHCYSLIHDDLPCMDDDDLRRGRPSCHKAFGEATALLAGDALLTAAFETLASARGTARQNVQAVQTLSRAAGANGMVWGQEQDLYYEQHAELVGEEQLKAIHRSKTGELIRAAALLGAIAADAPKEQCAAVGAYAGAVGMVFQIMDDVLDVTATEQELGKPIGSDAENGKTTFVTLYGVERSLHIAGQLTQDACERLEKTFGGRSLFLQTLADRLLHRSQ